MNRTKYDYSGKRVLVIGLGKSGLSSANFLTELGCVVDAYDDSLNDEMKKPLFGLVKNFYGKNIKPDFTMYDLAVVAPGVPLDIPVIEELKALKVEIIGEIELAYRFSEGKFVGITGTNGKTTTTSWIHHAFSIEGMESYLAGNIGIPLTDVVREHDSKSAVFITELSSYQLETIETFTPVVATILNVTPDHLKRHGTMDAYQDAKFRIQKNMKDKSKLILNFDDSRLSDVLKNNDGYSYFSKTNSEAISYVKENMLYSKPYGNEPVISVDEISLKGEHNLENALAVCAVSSLCGVGIESLRESLKTFKGVEHRNEYVATVNGIDCYNDSKATNPEASIPALKSFTTPILLIAGGMDKKSDYSEWIRHFDRVEKVFLFGETKHDIAKSLDLLGFENYELFDDLDAAFESAKKSAQRGDTILLSPACASWDMYKNFEERGEHFKRLCEEWKKIKKNKE